jgi:hypothetical protein
MHAVTVIDKSSWSNPSPNRILYPCEVGAQGDL